MKKILYVDDANSLRQLVEMVLGKDYALQTAEDGAAGLAKAQTEAFDLVISDVNMPNMNGFELLAELRKIDNYKYTPILMLTTEASAEMKEKGKSLGATGWIIKPFDPEKLTRLIERVLN
ncbi:response regulator [Thiomicrospira microaerophila]|uniref:response regulator n=1 Tax=Thiomicrospira microaerophila TaxID=406020 RepID=UPI0020108F11|nr:response regulator [Thiomicrospira microaerophila]UQB42620.1 response regulator [Thiomicrospira microaerophila]